MHTGAGEKLAFSRDVVVLTIHGADADLTLIDLPGLIHSHDKEPHMVGVTRELTHEYIRWVRRYARPAGSAPFSELKACLTEVMATCACHCSKGNTIIIAVISSKNDVENQVCAGAQA